jgi:3-oxoadipate enol-lactonase
MVAAVPLDTYAASCAAIRDTDLRPLMAEVALPVLVVGGRRDNATTASQARLLAQGIPGAALLELDAAHFSNWERPEEFNRAVTDFLLARL